MAHPRSRGENSPRGLPPIPSRGSSPLTRGKPLAGLNSPYVQRLIPAHAGKTTISGLDRHYCRAHPRSRGENGRRRRGILGHEGSSPLTRGKPWKNLVTRSVLGSSPLTRGKRDRQDVVLVASGLIPAHAGKTAEARQEALKKMGSSPLTRGKRRRNRIRRADAGLIPAHAGKTASR